MALPRPPRARVLVVEDTRLVREFLAELLGRSHDVTTAGSGREAIAAADAAGFQVAMVDYSLPDLRGDAVASALKARDAGMALILHTGHAFEARHPARQPFDFYVPKPAALADIERAVELGVALQKRRREDLVQT